MRKVYRVLALLIAAEVVVQAAALAFGVAGLVHWVAGGGVLDSAALEGGTDPFPEMAGLVVHGINGSIVVPALAVLLLVSSFFAHVPRGAAWAGSVLALVLVQGMLGFSLQDLPALGALHGLNALLLFAAAVLAARRAGPARTSGVQDRPATADSAARR